MPSASVLVVFPVPPFPLATANASTIPGGDGGGAKVFDSEVRH
jgi:hypothetical protein